LGQERLQVVTGSSGSFRHARYGEREAGQDQGERAGSHAVYNLMRMSGGSVRLSNASNTCVTFRAANRSIRAWPMVVPRRISVGSAPATLPKRVKLLTDWPRSMGSSSRTIDSDN